MAAASADEDYDQAKALAAKQEAATAAGHCRRPLPLWGCQQGTKRIDSTIRITRSGGEPMARRLGHLIVIIVIMAVAGAVPASSDPSPVKPDLGGAIVMGSIGDASILIPGLNSDSASSEITGYVYDGLVKYDKDIKVVGVLAESWQISPDGLTIVFKLRRGVKWQDGKPFTARDCVFTYRFMTNPKTLTPYRGNWTPIKKVVAVDDYTLKVTMKKKYAKAIIIWMMGMLPRHLLKGQNPRKSPLARHPIGNGPFRFVSWKSDQQIVVAANKDYWEGRPYLDRVVTRIIPDMATMFMELKALNIDYMTLTPLQWRRQTNTAFFKKNFRKYKYLAFMYTYLGFNLKSDLFRDRRVRQAIAYAVNTRQIIKGVLLGQGEPTAGPYKPGTWPYNTRLKPYPYDPARAARLLAAAGWKKGAGGRLYKNGRPFEFTLITNLGNESRKNTALIIQHQLKKVGITLKIRILEWTTFLKDFINPGRFQACLLGWTVPPDPDSYNVWHSSSIDKKNRLNFINFRNAEVDRLLVEGRHTLDQAKRKKIYDRFQEILHQEVPYVFLYVPYSLVILNHRFKNIKPAPLGIGYNFIRWWVPKGLQKYRFVR
jgi:peptide/nickel transport system substrate-binding protein